MIKARILALLWMVRRTVQIWSLEYKAVLAKISTASPEQLGVVQEYIFHAKPHNH